MAEPKVAIDFPWPVEAGFEGMGQWFKFPTDLGDAHGGHAPLQDGTLIAFLADPLGNACFARLRPETNWAIEERRKGKWPPAIKEPMDQAWRTLLDAFAAANRKMRALEASAGQLKDGDDGE